MSTPTDLDDTDMDDDCDARPTKTKVTGFVVPSIQTQKGGIIVTY